MQHYFALLLTACLFCVNDCAWASPRPSQTRKMKQLGGEHSTDDHDKAFSQAQYHKHLMSGSWLHAFRSVASAKSRLNQRNEVAWQQCITDPSLRVHDLTVEPDPPQRGVDMLLGIFGEATREIPSGQLIIEVYYLGFKVHSEAHDLCAATTCPVPVGSVTIRSGHPFPSLAPPGPYSMQVMVQSENDQAMCVKLDFTV